MTGPRAQNQGGRRKTGSNGKSTAATKPLARYFDAGQSSNARSDEAESGEESDNEAKHAVTSGSNGKTSGRTYAAGFLKFLQRDRGGKPRQSYAKHLQYRQRVPTAEGNQGRVTLVACVARR